MEKSLAAVLGARCLLLPESEKQLDLSLFVNARDRGLKFKMREALPFRKGDLCLVVELSLSKGFSRESLG